MDVKGYLERTGDPALRKSEYRALVRDYYDAVTTFYMLGWGDCFHFAPFEHKEKLKQAQQSMHQRLIRDGKIGPTSKVLDVGCGIGGPARSVASRSGAHVTGITVSPKQVRQANAAIARQGLEKWCVVHLEDAMQMSFSDESFDVVYTTEAACHMPDRARLYCECARILKPGGRLVGWDWIGIGNPNDSEAKHTTESICIHFALPSLATLKEIESNLASADFEIHSIEDLGATGRPDRRWWEPLEMQIQHPIARLTAKLSKTLSMMHESGCALVEGGKRSHFSPLGYFYATKPKGK
jgi:cyclopropane fatty-acyl-phospholipid synthase-like methyltransferase